MKGKGNAEEKGEILNGGGGETSLTPHTLELECK